MVSIVIFKKNFNEKTKFTRMCITEAILELLQTTSYDKLKISSIVRRAGIARMTFYKYYQSPYDALTDYMNIIISEYLDSDVEEHSKHLYLEYEHILYSLNFFDRYCKYFLTLARNQLHGILLDGINKFMEENVLSVTEFSLYQMYSYSGGLLNTFLKWEENGKEIPAEKVAMILYQLYNQQNRKL